VFGRAVRHWLKRVAGFRLKPGLRRKHRSNRFTWAGGLPPRGADALPVPFDIRDAGCNLPTRSPSLATSARARAS